jgi:hypothetical protein
VSKGKAREVPASASEVPRASPYSLRPGRGVKRRADADPPAADAPTADAPADPMAISDNEEATPRKSDAPPASELPLLHVDGGSPRPSQRARIEQPAAVATGDVRISVVLLVNICSYHIQKMCGPCQKLSRDECRSQGGSGRRLTIACTYCAAAKRTCKDPSPSWAMPLLAAINARGASPFTLFLSHLT